MKLTAFRIYRYKSILDSGWIEVSPLTALVGKNESGKTTVLKALHKFNPYDLYSKGHDRPKLKEVKPYYDDLIAEFFPAQIDW